MNTTLRHLCTVCVAWTALTTLAAEPPAPEASEPLLVSGIAPHLAAFNASGECGIGAVVPWAGKLWWISYPPHATRGSSDKLYSVGPDLQPLEIHPESVGGTHAGRMIHEPSNQLIIGPYFIDDRGRVRAVDVKDKLIGRMTAVARHLTDPANWVYYYDMEGAVYEVNVHSLEVRKLFAKPVPGWHGKGAYTAQGRLVIANNGEEPAGAPPKEYLAQLPSRSDEDAGVLAEWDGREWRIVDRRQYLDVTGPGGIRGAPDDHAPLWAIGWDRRSVLLKLLDGGVWSTFRIPKGSYAFDPKHGWYTEWPRIREVTGGKFLMVVHGQMFDFPRTFSRANAAGIRPLCTHLRYVPDLCGWEDKLVIAADDTSIMRNPLAGQSQSNLWFGTWDELTTWGPNLGWSGVWVGDAVKQDVPSDPFLFAGYTRRVLHLSHRADATVAFTVEADAQGDGRWHAIHRIEVPPKGYRFHVFDSTVQAEWVRLRADGDCLASAYFHLAGERPPAPPRPAGTVEVRPAAALIRPAHDNRNLQVFTADGYYEVDERLTFAAAVPTPEARAVRPRLETRQDFAVDAASVIVTDSEGRPWRLPKTDAAFDQPSPSGWPRGLREVQSERYLGNWHGLFYEVPRGRPGQDFDWPDYQKMKPVAAHRCAIADFCTWRGLLVLSGDFAPPAVGRVAQAGDGRARLWFGKPDDLWQFGKPVGHGGPWSDTTVHAGKPSDPFLMTNFDRKSLTLEHDAPAAVTFLVEVDFLATGSWREYARLRVPAGGPLTHDFPAGFAAHWVRITSDADCKATALFRYE